jgi:hypothetical protein
MTRDQASRCCDELNALDEHYVASVVEVGTKRIVGGFAVSVRHVPSGNEISFAMDMDEWRYVLAGMKRRLEPAT